MQLYPQSLLFSYAGILEDNASEQRSEHYHSKGHIDGQSKTRAN